MEIPEDYGAFEERVSSTKRPLKIIRVGKTGDESDTIKGLHYIPLSNFIDLLTNLFKVNIFFANFIIIL